MIGFIKQNSTQDPLIFLLVSSADGVSGVTGATPSVTISKNGAAFAASAGAISEIGNGWYKVAPNATDSNTLGKLIVHAAATGALPADAAYQVVAFDAEDPQRLGLAALPASGSVSTPAVAQTITPADTTAAQTAQTNIAAIEANVATIESGVSMTQATIAGFSSGGVTLAASQPHYAPAVAGAAMDLVASPRVAALNAIAAALLDLAGGVESTLTVRQAMRGITAVLLGKSAAEGTTFRDVADTTNRVAATVDSFGDRTAVTLNLE